MTRRIPPLRPVFDEDIRYGPTLPPPVPVVAELDNLIATHVDNQNTFLTVTVQTGSLVVVGSHIRRTSSAPTVARAPRAMTNVGPFGTLQLNNIYDGSGVSRGAVALFAAQATNSGTASEIVDTNLQQAALSFPPGILWRQSSSTVGQTDSVSASLGKAPANTVYAMLFTGGDQGTVPAPAVPAGWQQVEFEEALGSGGYKMRAAIYRGTPQSISLTLQTGATTGGGWGVVMFETRP